jgi:Thioredoxin like C-terminal domain
MATGDDAGGAEAAAALRSLRSPETYIGTRRRERFVSGDLANLSLNQWGLRGAWTVGPESATLDSAPGAIVFRFHARDVHLVIGPSVDGRPIRFRVRIDGHEPLDDHGTDVGGDGSGTVTEERLYQLIRQQGPIADRTIEIEFLDPGVQAYAFTFG